MDKIINPFSNVPYMELPESSLENQFLTDVKELQVGFGSKVLRTDRQGLWLGAERFADAPIQIDMEGNIILTSSQGNGQLIIDSTNTRILVKDENGVERVLVGYQLNGF